MEIKASILFCVVHREMVRLKGEGVFSRREEACYAVLAPLVIFLKDDTIYFI